MINYANISIALTSRSKSQLNTLATAIERDGLRSVNVNGYANKGGTTRSSNILSTREASIVASYLRSRLVALGVRDVSFAVVGHGATSFAVTPSTSFKNRWTEIIAKR
ncbi:MAG: OmpA family protein [Acidimicrobiales bacterium]